MGNEFHASNCYRLRRNFREAYRTYAPLLLAEELLLRPERVINHLLLPLYSRNNYFPYLFSIQAMHGLGGALLVLAEPPKALNSGTLRLLM